MINYKSCPICGHKDLAPLFGVKDHSITQEDFELAQCSNCNFTFTQNVPKEEDIARYYQSEEYISHSDTNKGLIKQSLPSSTKIDVV